MFESCLSSLGLAWAYMQVAHEELLDLLSRHAKDRPEAVSACLDSPCFRGHVQV